MRLLEIESGEKRCVKAINSNNYCFVFSMISTLFMVNIIDRFYVALFSALQKTHCGHMSHVILNETVSVFFFIARFYFIVLLFVLIFADVVY